MRTATVNDCYHSDCQQAETELAQNLPSIYTLRKGEIQWNWFYAYKLTELHDWCLANQPKVILELGSGWTTIVMSRYAAEFGARLVTVEESDEWRTGGQWGGLPAWAQVHWFMSPAMIDHETIRYRVLPDDLPEIDLLYVDGPASESFGRDLPGSDPVRIVESGVLVKNILVDIRNSTCDLMRDHLWKDYVFEPGGLYKWAKPGYLRPRRHHSWFGRK